MPCRKEQIHSCTEEKKSIATELYPVIRFEYELLLVHPTEVRRQTITCVTLRKKRTKERDGGVESERDNREEGNYGSNETQDSVACTKEQLGNTARPHFDEYINHQQEEREVTL